MAAEGPAAASGFVPTRQIVFVTYDKKFVMRLQLRSCDTVPKPPFRSQQCHHVTEDNKINFYQCEEEEVPISKKRVDTDTAVGATAE